MRSGSRCDEVDVHHAWHPPRRYRFEGATKLGSARAARPTVVAEWSDRHADDAPILSKVADRSLRSVFSVHVEIVGSSVPGLSREPSSSRRGLVVASRAVSQGSGRRATSPITASLGHGIAVCVGESSRARCGSSTPPGPRPGSPCGAAGCWTSSFTRLRTRTSRSHDD